MSSHTIPDKPVPVPSSRPTKATTKAPNQSVYSQPSKEQYDEPVSLNEHGEGGESEEIPFSEKNRLHQRLKQLTQQELAQVVYIIQESCA